MGCVCRGMWRVCSYVHLGRGLGRLWFCVHCFFRCSDQGAGGRGQGCMCMCGVFGCDLYLFFSPGRGAREKRCRGVERNGERENSSETDV